jgi:hypothetical protein
MSDLTLRAGTLFGPAFGRPEDNATLLRSLDAVAFQGWPLGAGVNSTVVPAPLSAYRALPCESSGSAVHSTSPMVQPNNRRPGLLPPDGGAWRGAELGSQYLVAPTGGADSGDKGGEKLAAYRQAYPKTPLHVYRSFNLTIGPGVHEWVKQGGILWYNIKTSKQMSWAEGASGGFDAEAKLWAAQVRSLAPAQVFVTIFHEPDHNICYVNCTEGGVPGNSPANYRNMWRTRTNNQPLVVMSMSRPFV